MIISKNKGPAQNTFPHLSETFKNKVTENKLPMSLCLLFVIFLLVSCQFFLFFYHPVFCYCSLTNNFPGNSGGVLKDASSIAFNLPVLDLVALAPDPVLIPVLAPYPDPVALDPVAPAPVPPPPLTIVSPVVASVPPLVKVYFVTYQRFLCGLLRMLLTAADCRS